MHTYGSFFEIEPFGVFQDHAFLSGPGYFGDHGDGVTVLIGDEPVDPENMSGRKDIPVAYLLDECSLGEFLMAYQTPLIRICFLFLLKLIPVQRRRSVLKALADRHLIKCRLRH